MERPKEIGLEQLQQRALKYQEALRKVNHAAGHLGTTVGPKSLVFEQANGLERISRIRRVGEIRETIQTKTAPILERHLEELNQQIAAHQLVTKAKADVEEIRRLVERGSLSRMELHLAERELRELTATAPASLAELPFLKPSQADASQQSVVERKDVQLPRPPEVVGPIPETPTRRRLEAADVEKEARLPKILIDQDNREITIGSRRIVFDDEAAWNVFLSLSTSNQKELSTSEAAELAKQAGSRRKYAAGEAARGIRQMIEEDPLHPKLLHSHGHSYHTHYQLNAEIEFVGQEERPQEMLTQTAEIEEAARVLQPAISQESLTEQKINEEFLRTPTVKVEDEGRRIDSFRLPTGEDLGGKIGQLLAVVSQASPDNPITSDQIAETLWPGVDWRVSRKRLGFTMFYARQKAIQAGLEVVSVHPLKRGTGEKSSYHLKWPEQLSQAVEPSQEVLEHTSVAPVELEKQQALPVTIEPKEKEAVQIHRESVTLPDGTVLSNLSRQEKAFLEFLLTGNEANPSTVESLGESVYEDYLKAGVPREKIDVRTRSQLKRLRKKLRQIGFDIFNKTPQAADKFRTDICQYYLAKTRHSQRRVEARISDAVPFEEEALVEPAESLDTTSVIDPGIKSFTPVVEVRGVTQEIREILYTPSEREVRTEEETRILSVIVDNLSAHTRLYFDKIQRELQSPDRLEQIPHGGVKFYIYHTRELKEKFISAYQKMVREEAIPVLRARWSQEDEELYGKMKALYDRLEARDMGNFFAKVQARIDAAQREFYKTYNSKNEGRPYVIL